ncbi:MAG: hypothetical protein PW735_04790 [Acidobacteriaceae bacterium]|nr:hypothetical protein [Acidobacteriaceae bacterium]
MRSTPRKRAFVIVLAIAVLLSALALALYLRAKAPPEAARLLPESDAIVFFQLKTLRSATHFDQTPITHSADFAKFIAATGIEPERDINTAAFALHRMADPNGPNGPVAYSEVFTGSFDGAKLDSYLQSIATAHESYADHTIYAVPVEGRTLRVTQLGYDTVAASNMPTTEQIHSILDRWRASALNTPGSSLLARRYGDVPLLSQAWGIGRIGLPFAQNGHIALFGLELPMSEDTELVASLRYTGTVRLRVEEFAGSSEDAHHTIDAATTLLNIVRSLASAGPSNTNAANAIRSILDTTKLNQQGARAILTANASLDEIKALSATSTTDFSSTPQPSPASK